MKINETHGGKSLLKSSKILSLVLRHKPEVIGLTLDKEGWANVNDLIKKINTNSEFTTNFDELVQVVANSDKQRFTFNDDRTKIRANQGHSLPVDLGLTPVEPPPTLYHGTAIRNISAIKKEGINKQARQHVHLSTHIDTAFKVGGRHGKPAILVIGAAKMHLYGHEFMQSKNGVWLTDHVPPQYIMDIIWP